MAQGAPRAALRCVGGGAGGHPQAGRPRPGVLPVHCNLCRRHHRPVCVRSVTDRALVDCLEEAPLDRLVNVPVPE